MVYTTYKELIILKESSMRNMIHLSFGEEVANSITHGVMSCICLLTLPAAAIHAYLQGGIRQAIGVSVFMISIFLMFLVSCLYHSMHYETNQKFVFRILDHSFIYVAIAGTYTPVALSIIGGWQGLVILLIQWTMVVLGILYKSIARKSYPTISVTIYLIMGWIAVLFFPTLIRNSSPIFLGLIVLGGILYTVGTYFYKRQYIKKYYHMIWHLCINLAALAHAIAIIFFIK